MLPELIGSALLAEGKLVSPITMKGFLPGDLNVGGLTINHYLARLSAEATTVANAPDYAKVVRDLADRRRIITVAEEAIRLAKVSEVDAAPEQIAGETISRINEILSKRLANVIEGNPLTAVEFLALELPPRETIIDPWLPAKGGVA